MNDQKTQTLEQILTEQLGLDALSPEKKEEMLERIAPLIMETAMLRAMDELPDEKILDFDILMETNPTPQAVLSFFKDNGVDIDKIIAEEIVIFQKGNKEE